MNLHTKNILIEKNLFKHPCTKIEPKTARKTQSTSMIAGIKGIYLIGIQEGLFFRHHIKRALRVEKLSPLKRESSRSSIDLPVKGRA